MFVGDLHSLSGKILAAEDRCDLSDEEDNLLQDIGDGEEACSFVGTSFVRAPTLYAGFTALR